MTVGDEDPEVDLGELEQHVAANEAFKGNRSGHGHYTAVENGQLRALIAETRARRDEAENLRGTIQSLRGLVGDYKDRVQRLTVKLGEQRGAGAPDALTAPAVDLHNSYEGRNLTLADASERSETRAAKLPPVGVVTGQAFASDLLLEDLHALMRHINGGPGTSRKPMRLGDGSELSRLETFIRAAGAKPPAGVGVETGEALTALGALMRKGSALDDQFHGTHFRDYADTIRSALERAACSEAAWSELEAWCSKHRLQGLVMYMTETGTWHAHIEDQIDSLSNKPTRIEAFEATADWAKENR